MAIYVAKQACGMQDVWFSFDPLQVWSWLCWTTNNFSHLVYETKSPVSGVQNHLYNLLVYCDQTTQFSDNIKYFKVLIFAILWYPEVAKCNLSTPSLS